MMFGGRILSEPTGWIYQPELTDHYVFERLYGRYGIYSGPRYEKSFDPLFVPIPKKVAEWKERNIVPKKGEVKPPSKLIMKMISPWM